MNAAEPAAESSRLELDELRRVSSPAGYTATRSATGFDIANDGGEIRFALRLDGGEWSVARAERSGRPTLEFSSASGMAVQRFMLLSFVGDIRQIRGNGRIEIEWKSVAPGFRLEERGDRVHLIRDGVSLAAFRRSSLVMDATSFSWIATAAPAGILASLLHVEGHPLLTRWVLPLPPALACDQCRDYYIVGAGGTRPKLLLVQPGGGLLRCETCGTYWIDGGGKTAKAVRPETALKEFPALQQLLGE